MARLTFLRKGFRNGQQKHENSNQQTNSFPQQSTSSGFPNSPCSSPNHRLFYSYGSNHTSIDESFLGIQSNTSRRRVQDLSRRPSDQGSTFGGKGIDELVESNALVLTLTPYPNDHGLYDIDHDDFENVVNTPVRPVMVDAKHLLRMPVPTEQSTTKSSEKEDGERTWGRHISTLDALFGFKQQYQPKTQSVEDEATQESAIIRVLSVDAPMFRKGNSRLNKANSAKKENTKTRFYGLKTGPFRDSVDPKMDKKSFDLESSAATSTFSTIGETSTEMSSASTNSDNDDDFDMGVFNVGECVNPVDGCRTIASDVTFFFDQLAKHAFVFRGGSFNNSQPGRTCRTNQKKSTRKRSQLV